MASLGNRGVGLRGGNFRLIKGPTSESLNYQPSIPVDDSLESHKEWFIRNIGGVGGVESVKLGPFYFVIEPEVGYAIILSDTRVEATFSVVRGDGSRLQDLQDLVGPVNGLGAVMWESVEPRINNQPMTGASCVNNGLKYFIDTILSCGQDALSTHLLLQMFHMDSPGEYDNMNLPMSSFRKRYEEQIARGEMTYKLPDDLKPLAKDAVYENGQRVQPKDIEKENVLRGQKRKEWYDRQFYNVMGINHERQQTLSLLDIEKEQCNLGFETRSRIVAGSEKFTLFSPVPHDLFNISNYLGPLNRLDLKMTMYPYRFLLNTVMHHHGYELRLHDLKLHLRSVKLNEAKIPTQVVESYEMNETHLYKHVVPHNLSNYSFRIQHAGVLPKTIVLAMVRTAAVEGNYQLNPFRFDHFNVKKISLYINGVERPQGGLNFNFDRRNADVARGYHWLFANTGALGNRGNLISYAHYQTGAFLVPFDLTPDRCNGAHVHNAELGYIDVNFTWGGEGLDEPITILYELMFNKLMINDKGSGQLSIVDVAA
jgi:hypothetical protein